jgi:hypothetical protein
LSLIIASLTAPLFLGVLLAQPAASSTRAAREREIVCTGPLPFSRKELQEALLPRWHLLGGDSVVRVTAEGGRTLVQVGSVEGQVDLEGREGEEAARIVAVMALDLAQAGTPLSVSPPPEASVSASASPPPVPSIKRQHALRAGFLLLSPFDQSGLVAHLEPTLDVGWEFVPGFGAFVAAGYRQAASTDAASALVLRELPLRAGLALRRRWLELRGAGTLRPRFVEGPHSYRDASWGAAVSVVARLGLTSKLALVVAGGVDLFRTRTVFAVNNDPALTTAWLSPWVGAGIAWETAL